MRQNMAVEQKGFGNPRNPHSQKIATIATLCVLAYYNVFELSRGVDGTKQIRPPHRLRRIPHRQAGNL